MSANARVDPHRLHVLVGLGGRQQVDSHDARVGEEGVETSFLGDGLLADGGNGLLISRVRLDGSNLIRRTSAVNPDEAASRHGAHLESGKLGLQLLGEGRKRVGIVVDHIQVLGACASNMLVSEGSPCASTTGRTFASQQDGRSSPTEGRKGVSRSSAAVISQPCSPDALLRPDASQHGNLAAEPA